MGGHWGTEMVCGQGKMREFGLQGWRKVLFALPLDMAKQPQDKLISSTHLSANHSLSISAPVPTCCLNH